MKNGLVLIFNRKETDHKYIFNLIEVSSKQDDSSNQATHQLDISPMEFPIDIQEQDFANEEIIGKLIKEKAPGIYLYCCNLQLCAFCPGMNKINSIEDSKQLESNLTQLIYDQFIFI